LSSVLEGSWKESGTAYCTHQKVHSVMTENIMVADCNEIY